MQKKVKINNVKIKNKTSKEMRRSNLMNIDWKLPRYIDAKNFCRIQLFPDKCLIIEIE